MSVTVELDYQPLPTQARFHASPAKFRAFVGGLGSGKTRAGCVEALGGGPHCQDTKSKVSKLQSLLSDRDMRLWWIDMHRAPCPV